MLSQFPHENRLHARHNFAVCYNVKVGAYATFSLSSILRPGGGGHGSCDNTTSSYGAGVGPAAAGVSEFECLRSGIFESLIITFLHGFMMSAALAQR